MRPIERYSMLFHFPGMEFIKTISDAYELPVYTERGESLEDLKNLLKKCVSETSAEGVVSGALLSDYQRLRFLGITDELGLYHFTPLWKKDQKEYMINLVEEGFEFIIIRISTYGLPMDYLGKIIDKQIVKDIIKRAEEYGFNPAFEGGEAETLVVKAPLMKKRIYVDGQKVIYDQYNGEYIIKTLKTIE